ncbi:MAG: hypothetical protein R3E12_08580 [Candidatus Eisenbacteria bacterium]
MSLRTSFHYDPAMTTLDLGGIPGLLDAFSHRAILVLGDLMLDRYVWGDTQRISPEAPVPVVEARRKPPGWGGGQRGEQRPGARGTSVVGGCLWPGWLWPRPATSAGGHRVTTEDVCEDQDRRTTCKTRVIARHQQVVRIDREDPEEVSGAVMAELRERALARLEESQACVISDYGKGVITPAVLDPVLERAREGIPVCVDPKERISSVAGKSPPPPNQSEASVAAGFRIHDRGITACRWRSSAGEAGIPFGAHHPR